MASLVPGGVFVEALFEEVAGPFCESAWRWLKDRNAADRVSAVEGLAAIDFGEARALAEEALSAVQLAPAARSRLIDLMAAVPATALRAVARPDDQGRPSVLLSQLPLGPEDIVRWLPSRPPRFAPGHRMPGYDYELEALLGQGGFGEVWLARHTRRAHLAKRAVKFCLDAKLAASLERELALCDRLEAAGPNEGIVTLYETALSADPPFLVYEFVDGGSLVGWLATFEGTGAPARAVLRILRMAAKALAPAPS